MVRSGTAAATAGTHARWAFVAVVMVAVILPSWGAAPFLAAVGLAVAASRWSVRRSCRRLEVGCRAPRWAEFGQPIEVTVELRNHSRLPVPWAELDVPCGLGLGRDAPHREALMLPPGATVSRTVPLRGVARGRHHVGPVRVRLGDVLGIAERRPDAPAAAPVTVFPRIVPLRTLGLPAESPLVVTPAPRSLLVDQTRITGTRDYEPGDPYHWIHWPATARSGRLAVKRYEPAEARDTVICLDLCQQGYGRERWRSAIELAIVVAASVAYHTIAVQRMPAGLVLAGRASSGTAGGVAGRLELPPAGDAAHLRRLLETLALVDPPGDVPLADVLSTLGHGLGTGTTVLAVTGSVEPAAAAHLARLASGGAAVALALTGADGNGVPGTSPRGMRVYRIEEPDDLPVLATAGTR